MKVIRDDMVCFHLVFMYLTGAVNIIYQPKEYNWLSHISLVENKGKIIPLLSRAIFDIPDQSSSIASLWTIPTGIAAIQIDCSKAKYFFYFRATYVFFLNLSFILNRNCHYKSSNSHFCLYSRVYISVMNNRRQMVYTSYSYTWGEKNIKEISI